MFEKLIESGSHAQDLTRKGSFFAMTLGVYALLILFAGLGSIYAYDAHLDRQELQLSVLLTPILDEQPSVKTEAPRNEAKSVEQALPSRVTPIASVLDPTRVNQQVSIVANHSLPVPHGIFTIGKVDSDLPVQGVPGINGNARNGGGHVVEVDNPPPPAAVVEPRPQPAATQRPKIMTLGVIEGIAIYKPKPVYSAIAKAAHASGPVVVQIIVDEDGKVISAKALSGHALLQQAAVQAAYQAKFTPTLLSKVPVKVSGVITYNFVLQ